MAMNWRSGGLGLVTGVLLGAAGAVALVGQVRDTDPPAAAAPGGGTVQQTAATTPVAPAVSCSFAPVVAVSGREDGMLPLDKDLQGTTSSAVNTLLLTGKEAAAAGKMRDAETAFLMACRSAETLKRDPIPLADAHYQLARHYAQAASMANASRREELQSRAERLYASSLQAYRTHRGPDHEKTRFAQQGLDALKQQAGLTAAAAPAPAPDLAAGTAAAENTRMAGAASAPAPEPAPKVTAKPAEPTTPPPVAVAPQPAPKPQQKAVAKREPKVEAKSEAPRATPAPVERPVRTARPAPVPVAPEPAPEIIAPAPRETGETEILGGPPATAAGDANAPVPE
jgi:outer membrane biosynthesis protein TonB